MKAKSALIVVDVQNDFLPGGPLGIDGGDTIIAAINSILEKKEKLFDLVIATKDWHPANHSSFAVNNPNGPWPVHCVQDSLGSDFANGLRVQLFDKVVQKGMNPEIDSYSGFFDNDQVNMTDLQEYLSQNGIKKLFVLGLATDYCVKFTVLDALRLKYEVVLLLDGCRAVNIKKYDENNAVVEMINAGAKISTSVNLLSA